MFSSIPGKEVIERAEAVIEDPLEGAEGVTEDPSSCLLQTYDMRLQTGLCTHNQKALHSTYLLFNFNAMLPFQYQSDSLHNLLSVSTHYFIYMLENNGKSTITIWKTKKETTGGLFFFHFSFSLLREDLMQMIKTLNS